MNQIGIINYGNQCFLNALLQCLATLDVENDCPNRSQFAQYLRETLTYIRNNRTRGEIGLFWVELQNRNPHLFSKEKQEAQDAAEVLMWIVEEAELQEMFQIQTNSQPMQFPLCVELPALQPHIMLVRDWTHIERHYISDGNLSLLEIAQIMLIEQPLFYRANNVSIELIDALSCISEQYNCAKDYSQTIYIEDQQYFQGQLLLKIQLMYFDERGIYRAFAFSRPLYLDQLTTCLQLYQIIGAKLNNSNFQLKINDQLIDPLPVLVAIDCNDVVKVEFLKYVPSLDILNSFTPIGHKNNYFNLLYQIDCPMEFPQVLVIQLQRFRMQSNFTFSKRNKLVQYPLQIHNKQLVAICCHRGGVSDGHYYAICKKLDNRWYLIDDDKQISINVENVITKHAYLLFYL